MTPFDIAYRKRQALGAVYPTNDHTLRRLMREYQMWKRTCYVLAYGGTIRRAHEIAKKDRATWPR